MHLYEMEWITKDRLDAARAEAARRRVIQQALADRPPFTGRLGRLRIRIGTRLQDRAAGADVEATRAAA